MTVFVLTGADGDSAGGQLVGRQRHAEDGPTLLICTMASLQWQVLSYIPLRSDTIICSLLIHVFFCVSSSLFRFKHPSEGELCALAGKQMPKQNRRDRWGMGEGLIL